MNYKKAGFAVVLCVLLSFASLGCLATKTTTDQYSSAMDISEIVNDADNAIYNYEWFEFQYAEITATEKKIRTAQTAVQEHKDMFGPAIDWSPTTQTTYSRLKTNEIGLVNHYDSSVEEYNARAKLKTRSIFKNKLPFHVDKILW